jgi:hypothetical protein
MAARWKKIHGDVTEKAEVSRRWLALEKDLLNGAKRHGK